MVNWGTILDWIKLKPKHLLAAGVTCLFVVNLPKSWRIYLGYDELIMPYRGLVSIVGVALCVYGGILLITEFKDWVVIKWTDWQLKKQDLKKLKNLADDEKKYLAEYIRYNASSMKFHATNGIVGGLVSKNLLYKSTQIPEGSVIAPLFAYNIQTWVLEAFEEYPELKSDIRKHASEETLGYGN